jgi:hypothetical protein
VTVGQRHRCDISVHLNQLRLQAFIPEKTLLHSHLHRKPSHAHRRIGKRNFSGFGFNDSIRQQR